MLIRPRGSRVAPRQYAHRRRLARGRSNARTLTRVIKIAELPFRCSCYGCKCRHCRRCRRRRHHGDVTSPITRRELSLPPAPRDNHRSTCLRAGIRRLVPLGVSCRRQVLAIFSRKKSKERALLRIILTTGLPSSLSLSFSGETCYLASETPRSAHCRSRSLRLETQNARHVARSPD